MSIRSLVKQILVQKENKRYEKRLSAGRMTYEEWIQQLETPTGKETPAGEKTFPGEVQISFYCFLLSVGEPAENAFLRMEQYFRDHPEVLILYGDEDVRENGRRKSPWFKPDWSPDLLDSCFYFGSVVALRKELLCRIEEKCGSLYGSRGMDTFASCVNTEKGKIYRVTDRGSFERWIHICLSQAGAHSRGSRVVGHIPEILFHCESEEEQRRYLTPSSYLWEAKEEPLRDFRDRRGLAGSDAVYDGETENKPVEQRSEGRRKPLVSVVIPSRDHPQLLESCIQGCMLASGMPGETWQPDFCEIVVVDNGSSEEHRRQIREMVERTGEAGLAIVYCYQPMEFHFSRMCNLGAERASGEFLLFLNDDVELCEPGCIGRMAALADRPYTGAVGMKLYYPDSRRIQHAGITNLPMGPVHKLQFLTDEVTYYYESNRGLRNVMAVTGACLMVQKERFNEAGGFSEELPVAFNDVDLCFTLSEMGYWNVCMNDSHGYHHESLSRGDDESPEKIERLLTEREKLYKRHPSLEGVDPFYSVHLNRQGLDTRIRPAYETAGNCLQKVDQKPAGRDLKEYRRDACVLLRVESCRDGLLQGYGVVLGDNNACYDKEILLTGENTEVYAVPIEGRYRPDLVENMPDQINVGLSGFWIGLSQCRIPRGRYRVGMAVRNRVTGLKLWNDSNCYFMVED